MILYDTHVTLCIQFLLLDIDTSASEGVGGGVKRSNVYLPRIGYNASWPRGDRFVRELSIQLDEYIAFYN
jgi:hypothetical protein